MNCFFAGTILRIVFFPMRLAFFLTIPNVNRGPTWAKMYPVSFIICICWIGASCYVSTWMITIIGYTFSIPDSVMGLTFLAVGTSFPEVFSAYMVSRAGHGSMAVSTSIGSNTFDILIGLGLPWFIMSLVQGANEGIWLIKVESKGLGHVVTSLLVSLVTLYVLLIISKFTLSKKLGLVCMLIYLVFVVMSVLVEMNVFSEVNQPMCVMWE
jgi:Ca2+/Na+ antiporter